MTHVQVELLAAAGIAVAVGLLWRRVIGLASALVFVSNLPGQHRENIAAIAGLTVAVKDLTKTVDRLSGEIDALRQK